MHYVYRTTFQDGQYYIGVRKLPASSTPEEDSYLGSGKALRRLLKTAKAKKQVVAVYEDKQEAYQLERQLVTYETLQDPLCLNLVLGGRGGYLETVSLKKRWQRDRRKLLAAVEKTASTRRGKTKYTDAGLKSMALKLEGRRKETHDHVSRMAAKLSGRTKQTHGYLEKAGQKVSEKLKNRPRPDVAARMSSDKNPSRKRSLSAARLLEQLDTVPQSLLMFRHPAEAQQKILDLAKLGIPREQIFLQTGIPESTVNAFVAKLVRWVSLPINSKHLS